VGAVVAVELSAAERLRPSPVLWVVVAALGTVTVALLFAFIGMWLGWGPRRELPAQQREQYPALRYRPPPPMAVPTTYPRPATGVAPLSVWGNTEALVRLDAQGQPVGQQTAVAVAEGATAAPELAADADSVEFGSLVERHRDREDDGQL
jgi:hypothetical protein